MAPTTLFETREIATSFWVGPGWAGRDPTLTGVLVFPKKALVENTWIADNIVSYGYIDE